MWTSIAWAGSYILAVALGVGIGYLWGQSERRHKIAQGETVVVDGRPRITMVQRVFAGVITILAVVMVVQTSAANERDKRNVEEQSRCNAQLYAAIEQRAQANAEDEQLQREDNASLLALVERLITLPPDGDDEMRDALREYRAQIEAHDKRRMENDVKRAENPYPKPECGRV